MERGPVTDLDRAVAELQRLLALNVVCGSITLNVNQGELQSIKTETFQRVASKVVDRREHLR